MFYGDSYSFSVGSYSYELTLKPYQRESIEYKIEI